MRKPVKKAKGQCIHKLTRLIQQLRKKKGTEEQLNQNGKKADRFHEEIAIIKGFAVDKVSKFALQNTTYWNAITKQPNVNLETRCLTRLSDHKDIQNIVTKFREGHDDWRDLAAFIAQKNTGRRMKKKKTDGKDSVLSLEPRSVVSINSHEKGDNVEEEEESLEQSDSDGSESDLDDTAKITSFAGSKTKQKFSHKDSKPLNDKDNDGKSDDDDGGDEDSNDSDDDSSGSCNDEKDNRNENNQKNTEKISAKDPMQEPSISKQNLASNKEMIIKKINLDNLEDEDTITASEPALDNLQDNLNDETVEEEKPNVKKRSAFFLSGNDSEDGESSEDETSKDPVKESASFEQRGFMSRGRGRGRGRGGSVRGSGRGGMNSRTSLVGDNKEKQDKPEKLHPSWEASKKRKQQIIIQEFQGKKIKFDDD